MFRAVSSSALRHRDHPGPQHFQTDGGALRQARPLCMTSPTPTQRPRSRLQAGDCPEWRGEEWAGDVIPLVCQCRSNTSDLLSEAGTQSFQADGGSAASDTSTTKA